MDMDKCTLDQLLECLAMGEYSDEEMMEDFNEEIEALGDPEQETNMLETLEAIEWGDYIDEGILASSGGKFFIVPNSLVDSVFRFFSPTTGEPFYSGYIPSDMVDLNQ